MRERNLINHTFYVYIMKANEQQKSLKVKLEQKFIYFLLGRIFKIKKILFSFFITMNSLIQRNLDHFLSKISLKKIHTTKVRNLAEVIRFCKANRKYRYRYCKVRSNTWSKMHKT